MIELISQKTKSKKRLGRGISAGGGKTAGRGTKGQKSRAGHNIPKRYEGGQTPLSMRLPKLPGFNARNKKAVILSLDQISAAFKDGEIISVDSLVEKKLIEKNNKKIKILNNGKLSVKVMLSPEIRASKSIVKLFEAIQEKPAQTSPSQSKKIAKVKSAEIKAKDEKTSIK